MLTNVKELKAQIRKLKRELCCCEQNLESCPDLLTECETDLTECAGDLLAAEAALAECEETIATPLSFNNNKGTLISPISNFPTSTPSATNSTLNATGHSVTLIGKVIFSEGSGTKTISSAGGHIYFPLGTTTFAAVGSTIRVGVQDVAATGLEDTTFDVYADLAAGTDLLTSNVVAKIAMETGSKNITNGDIVAFSMEFTNRVNPDSVVITRRSAIGTWPALMPYLTQDTGAGIAKVTTQPPQIAIQFDDGTIGYMSDLIPTNTSAVTLTIGVGAESGLIFTLPINAELTAVFSLLGVASNADFNAILYSDPLGTPIIEDTVAIDASFTTGTTSLSTFHIDFPNSTLLKDTPYAIVLAPTVTNITMHLLVFNHSELRKITPLGENWTYGTRAGGVGPFVPTDTQLPGMALYVDNLTAG